MPHAFRLAPLAVAVSLLVLAGSAAAAREVATLPADLQRLDAARAAASPSAVVRPAEGTAGDVKPPKLTAFQLPATIDAAVAGGDARITFSASDAGSGVADGTVTLTGPHGETMAGWFGDHVASPKVTRGRGHLQVSAWAMPGTWTVQSVRVNDYLGNASFYDAAAIAAMGGSTQVTVTNRKGGDGTAPTLVHGHLRSTVFSKSAIQPGTVDAPAQFVIDMTVNDAGDPQVSGVRSALLTYCLEDQSRCLNVVSSDQLASGQREATLAAWQVPGQFSSLVPGWYRLKEVRLYDHAGNQRLMTSVVFGGSTDFMPLFDNATDFTLTN